MATFRVTGTDGYTGEDREAYFEADDPRAAHLAAARRGILDTHAEPIDPGAVPEGRPVLNARTPTGVPSDLGTSLLLTRPIHTIAWGVGLGILGALLVVVIVQAIFLFVALALHVL